MSEAQAIWENWYLWECLVGSHPPTADGNMKHPGAKGKNCQPGEPPIPQSYVLLELPTAMAGEITGDEGPEQVFAVGWPQGQAREA